MKGSCGPKSAEKKGGYGGDKGKDKPMPPKSGGKAKPPMKKAPK
jgi:hypothetical protein